ncbi:MAG TPA: FAD-dependent oxidoreductase [Streptosporangiaceae bacterium]|nr:FAD-dependent oxidoreductase [Streptosporangiaceae bacterium]
MSESAQSQASGAGADAAQGLLTPDGWQALSETPDSYGAYPRLSDAQITALAACGARRRAEPGETLFRDGDPSCDFFVVLAGKAAVVEGYGSPGQRLISVHGAGRFLGELNLLTGQAAFYSAVMAQAGEILAVPEDCVRDLVASDPTLGDLILRACLLRRSILIGLGIGIRIIGSRYSPDVGRLRDFAARNRLPHRWEDLEADPAAESLLRQLGVPPEDTPIVILYGKQLLRNPSNATLAAAIGLPAAVPAAAVSDLIVIGAGPAGLSVAVYGASEGLSTVALDATATGGQAGTSSRIENYLGFPAGISGAELADRAVIQARKFGASLGVPARATSLRQNGGHYAVGLDTGEPLPGRVIVIATGARYRRLQVPRIEHFEGTSVYYAASQAEAQLCRGDPVAIVGGGNSAGQAAVFLARNAERVTLLVRDADLGKSMSRYLVDQIVRTEQIEVLCHTEVRELLGEDTLRGLVAEDNQSGARRQLDARALFVFIGAVPATGWLSSQVMLDDHGFVLTGLAVTSPAGTWPADPGSRRSALETSLPGVFAAGDVRSGSVKRVASAVGEGAMAVHLVFERMQSG